MQMRTRLPVQAVLAAVRARRAPRCRLGQLRPAGDEAADRQVDWNRGASLLPGVARHWSKKTSAAAGGSALQHGVSWYLAACRCAAWAAAAQRLPSGTGATPAERAAAEGRREARRARRNGALPASQHEVVDLLAAPLPQALSRWLEELHSAATCVLSSGNEGDTPAVQRAWQWLEEQCERRGGAEGLCPEQCDLLQPLLDPSGLLTLVASSRLDADGRGQATRADPAPEAGHAAETGGARQGKPSADSGGCARLLGRWDQRWDVFVQPALEYYHSSFGNLDVPIDWVSPPHLGEEPVGEIVVRMKLMGSYISSHASVARLQWLLERGWTIARKNAEWYSRASALSLQYARHGRLLQPGEEPAAVSADERAPAAEELALPFWMEAQRRRAGALSPAKRLFLASIPTTGVSAGATAQFELSLPLPPAVSPLGRQLLDEAALGAAARGQLLLETGAAVRQIDHGRSYRELIDLPRLRRFARSRANGDTAAARALLRRAARAAQPPTRVHYYRTAFSGRRWQEHAPSSLQGAAEGARSAAAGAHYAQLCVVQLRAAVLAQLTGRSTSGQFGGYALAPLILGTARHQELCEATGCPLPAAPALVNHIICGGTVQGWCSVSGVGEWPTHLPECPKAWVARAAARASSLPAEAQPRFEQLADTDPLQLRRRYREWYKAASPEVQALLQGLPRLTADLVRDAAAARAELLQHEGVRELGARVAVWCKAREQSAGGAVVRRKPEHTTLSLVLSLYEDLIMSALEKEAQSAGFEVGCLLHDGLLLRGAEGATDLPKELLVAMRARVQETFGFRLVLEQREWVKPVAETIAEECAIHESAEQAQVQSHELRVEQAELEASIAEGHEPKVVIISDAEHSGALLHA